LVNAGLLVSYDELRKAQPLAQKLSWTPITSTGVVTRNRVDCLRRCLTSFIENSRKHDRSIDFVVMDDSNSPDVRAGNREVLLSLRKLYGANVSYGGLPEKRRFADALVKAGELPAYVVQFALFGVENFGYTAGANRNALLLHTAGELVFSADDDTVCKLVQPPVKETGVGFDSRDSLSDYWFFEDRKMTLQNNQPVENDVLAEHEQLLGRSISESLAERPHLDHCGPQLLRAIKFGRGSVLATFNGVFGDSGLVAPFSYFLLEGKSRERLVKSEAIYRNALSSRETLRIVSRPTISNNSWCMTTAVGLDNRVLLPPFLPIQRNQDGIFGSTLRKCFAEGYCGHLPQAVFHSPPQARSYPPLNPEDAPLRLSSFELIAACIGSFEPGPGDSRELLCALGRHLMQIGSMSDKDNEEFLRIQIFRSRSSLLLRLESLLQTYRETPVFWANDVKRHIRVLRAALLQKDYIVPQDLLSSRTRDEAMQLNKHLISQFGKLLYWWPQMTESARLLRARGERLAQPVC